MKAVPPDQPAEAASDVIEWRPNLAIALLWNLLAVPMMLGSLLLFFRLATLPLGASGRAVFRPMDLLLILLVTVVVTAALLAAHEGLHGLVMAGLGARPRFGALMIARMVPALFTTAPAHLFTRPQYLAVALTPAATISALGALACLTPVGLYLVVPLAIHFAGCVGDFSASLRLLGEPRGTLCEDLRDGIRFYRPHPRP
jgi:putative zincin peptidase